MDVDWSCLLMYNLTNCLSSVFWSVSKYPNYKPLQHTFNIDAFYKCIFTTMNIFLLALWIDLTLCICIWVGVFTYCFCDMSNLNTLLNALNIVKSSSCQYYKHKYILCSLLGAVINIYNYSAYNSACLNSPSDVKCVIKNIMKSKLSLPLMSIVSVCYRNQNRAGFLCTTNWLHD